MCSRDEHTANLNQLRKDACVPRQVEVANARRAAGPRPVADDPLHHPRVAVAKRDQPSLELNQTVEQEARPSEQGQVGVGLNEQERGPNALIPPFEGRPRRAAQERLHRGGLVRGPARAPPAREVVVDKGTHPRAVALILDVFRRALWSRPTDGRPKQPSAQAPAQRPLLGDVGLRRADVVEHEAIRRIVHAERPLVGQLSLEPGDDRAERVEHEPLEASHGLRILELGVQAPKHPLPLRAGEPEQLLELPHLKGLGAARRAELVAKRQEALRPERLHERKVRRRHAERLVHPREVKRDLGDGLLLEMRPTQRSAGLSQLAKHELEQELDRLMNDDEVKLVGRGDVLLPVHAPLEAEEPVEPSVLPIGGVDGGMAYFRLIHDVLRPIVSEGDRQSLGTNVGGKRRARVGEGSLRQREDGTWELRFRHGGETISVYGKTPAAARTNRNEKLAKLGEAPTQARRRVQGLTLRAWAKEWLATGQSPRKGGTPWSAKTRERYRTHIRDLDQRWGGAALARLDGQEVTNWIRQRYPNAPSQQFHCSVTIRACVAAAIRARKLGKHEDPFAGVPRIQQPKRQLKAGRRNKAWTQDEVRALLAAATEVDAKAKFVQVRPALVVMLGSGLGPGELLGLEPRHVDWRANTIAVEQHRDGPVKTDARPRTVRVSDQVMEALATLRDATSTRYLFEGGYDALKDAIEKACERAEVPYLGPHACRHTHASNALAKGCSLPDLSKRLGHADLTTTLNQYSWALASTDERAIHALDLS